MVLLDTETPGTSREIYSEDAEEVFVVCFIPIYQVLKGLRDLLDPFLKPLMLDLVDAFIIGYETEYPLKHVPEYTVSPVECTCVILLCWLGDHIAQCEVGKVLNQGKCPCRRCRLIGSHINDPMNNHFYYGENRFHARFPWDVRKIEEECDRISQSASSLKVIQKSIFVLSRSTPIRS